MAVAQRSRPRGNVPFLRPLKWTVESGSREFRLSPVTLRKVLRQNDIQPASDGTYSTTQIVSALFGDLKAERLKKERALTEKYSLENLITKAEYLNRTELSRALAGIADAIVSRVMNSPLPRDVQEAVLRDIAGLPLTLAEVGDKQSKLRRNGKKDSGED